MDTIIEQYKKIEAMIRKESNVELVVSPRKNIPFMDLHHNSKNGFIRKPFI